MGNKHLLKSRGEFPDLHISGIAGSYWRFCLILYFFTFLYGKFGRFMPVFCGKFAVFVAFLWRNENAEIMILTNIGNRVYT